MTSSDQTAAISAAIRDRRKTLGLTQAELAELAGVSTRFVHVLEDGKQTVQLAKLTAVAAALGLELALQLRDVSDR